jgi:hypothetical protein
MSTETVWVYRVDEPNGSEGWRPYGDRPRVGLYGQRPCLAFGGGGAS